jgi:uncharacterized protein YecT (DUF1311 family)
MAIGIFAGVALVLAAAAGEAPVDCSGALSTHDMLECNGRDFRQADAQLNALYPKVLKSLKDSYPPDAIRAAGGQDPVKDLRDAQRKWVAFRDANCRSLATVMLGGTGQAVIEGGCRARMTRERIKELQEFLPE